MMKARSGWGRDGWAIQPGGGELIELGGPHRPEILVRGDEVGGKLLFVSAPAGNEELFIELGRLGSDPTAEQLAAIDERFATTGLPGDEGRPWRQLRAE